MKRSKPAEDTMGRLRRILESGSHQRADRDLALLAQPELRSIRLQLEYLKPELAFRKLGIRHTIVVFGSTRLVDPAVATRELRTLELEPRGPERTRRLVRARAAVARSRYYRVGRELGRLIGRCGEGPDRNRLAVVTGGGPGGMEATNRGALDVGAASVGLNITLPREQEPNPYLTPELSFQFRYFALRKLHFMLRARALVALPGGFGTFDELFETLCLIQTGKRTPLPVVLIGADFWRRAIDFDFLLEEAVVDPEDLALFSTAETAAEAWDQILGWYAARGRSIFDEEDRDEDRSA